MTIIQQDIRFSIRQFRRAPGFVLTAVITLALGIGANTAVFSLLDQALLRSLPVSHPDELVVLEGTGKVFEGHTGSHGGDKEAYFSYPMYRDLLTRDHAFQSMIGTMPASFDLVWHNTAQVVPGEVVSGNYFSMLGTLPFRGRLLNPSDDTTPNGNSVVVLSFDFWRNHLGAPDDILGRALSLNGHPFQVVGVASPNFHSAVWGETPAFFIPMSMIGQAIPGEELRLTNHKDRWLNIIARLQPGETAAQAQAASAPLWYALRAEELKALGNRSPYFTQEFLNNSKLLVLPGNKGFSYSRDTLQRPLLVVMGMAVLVLLIAAVNVASLLLVRSANRIREFSLRSALGAGNDRLLKQLLVEGLLIGLAGASVGLLLAPVALRLLIHQLAGVDEVTPFSAALDLRLLAFNFGVALVISIVFSLAPAVQIRRPDLTMALRENTSSGSGSLLRLRHLVVSLQIGLSVLLLAASGLFLRTMHNLRAFDVGFDATRLITFGVNPRLAGYAVAQTPALERRIIETLSKAPGVEAVAATDSPELSDNTHGGTISIEGYHPARDEDIDVLKTGVNPGFFDAMHIGLLAGRSFADSDDAGHPLVAIVNQSLAKLYFGSVQNAIGRRISDGGSDTPVLDTVIVGVVKDFKQAGIREAVEPTVFRPYMQPTGGRAHEVFFYLRTRAGQGDPSHIVRSSLQQLDPALAVEDMRTMDEQIEDSLQNDSTVELLAISFGVLATLLAGVGLYGVLAYSTAQRTREIGIRIALGSSRSAVSRMVLFDVLRLAAIGICLAVPVALALARVVRAQLFGVSPADPLTLSVVVGLICIVALLAASVPARRAASINPITALRTE